jgi:hypothetical protein
MPVFEMAQENYQNHLPPLAAAAYFQFFEIKLIESKKEIIGKKYFSLRVISDVNFQK